MAENIKKFDSYAAEYLQKLYASFPVEINVSSSDFEEFTNFDHAVKKPETASIEEARAAEQLALQRVEDGKLILDQIKLRRATLRWLHRTGFFTGEEKDWSSSWDVYFINEYEAKWQFPKLIGHTRNVSFTDAALTLKGLEVLRSVPESVNGEVNNASIGDLLARTGVEAAEEARSEFISSIVGAIVRASARIPIVIAEAMG
ncbi:MAG: hypothetical protein AAF583_02770 [Pseudomonadota bacterium]